MPIDSSLRSLIRGQGRMKMKKKMKSDSPGSMIKGAYN